MLKRSRCQVPFKTERLRNFNVFGLLVQFDGLYSEIGLVETWTCRGGRIVDVLVAFELVVVFFQLLGTRLDLGVVGGFHLFNFLVFFKYVRLMD